MKIYIESIALSVSLLLMIQQGKSDCDVYLLHTFEQKCKSINKVTFLLLLKMLLLF